MKVSENSSDHLAAGAVFLIASIVFLPALRNDFIDWDDVVYIVSNPRVHGLNWVNLRWMLTTFNLGHYIPLTWLSFALEYSLWGLNPAGYHATNIALHASNALFFYCISRKLLDAALKNAWDNRSIQAASACAALLFALHPLRVESVAWVFERKDVLSGFFYLAAVLTYLNSFSGKENRRWAWRWSSWILYALSLLSKAIGVSLPIALFLLDLYPLRRLPTAPKSWLSEKYRGVILEKLSYAVLALAACAITLSSINESGASMHLASYGIAMRAAQSFFGLVFYLRKTILPIGLSPRYLHPTLNPFGWQYLISAAIVIFLTAIFWTMRRRFPGGLTAWVYYGATLAPVVGIIPQSSQITANRYTYLPCLGWALCAGAGLGYLLHKRSTQRTASVLTLTLLVSLSALTWGQIAVWHDSLSLWERAVEINSEDIVALNGLGRALAMQGRMKEAEAKFQESFSINPSVVKTHMDLGTTLAREGRIREAAAQFQAAVDIDPHSLEARYNLGKALAILGRTQDAARQFRQALAIDRNYAPATQALQNLLRSRQLDKILPQ